MAEDKKMRGKSIVIVLLSQHSLGSDKMSTQGPVGSVKGYYVVNTY